MSSENSTSISVKSRRTHWVWHSALLMSAILVFAALMFDAEFIETWFSKDHHLTQYTRNVLSMLRISLVALAGCCIILWFLKKMISSDWQATVLRSREMPYEVRPSEIIPAINAPNLNRILCLLLPIWMVFVTICLIPGNDEWSCHLVKEFGPLEILTVVCYLFSGLAALKLALPLFRRNAQRGFLRWWLLGILLGCFFIAGEETNWLEVYFQYDFGNIIREANYQNEISLHNIWLPIVGRYWANDLQHIITALGGILLPFLILLSNFFRRWMLILEVPVPPWISQAYFFAAAIIPPDWLLILQRRRNLPSEMREFTFAIGVAIWLWYFMQNRHKVSAKFNN